MPDASVIRIDDSFSLRIQTQRGEIVIPDPFAVWCSLQEKMTAAMEKAKAEGRDNVDADFRPIYEDVLAGVTMRLAESGSDEPLSLTAKAYLCMRTLPEWALALGKLSGPSPTATPPPA